MGERDATLQDIRPMRIAILNLMPRKEKIETQLTRLIGATPLQVEVTLLTTPLIADPRAAPAYAGFLSNPSRHQGPEV